MTITNIVAISARGRTFYKTMSASLIREAIAHENAYSPSNVDLVDDTAISHKTPRKRKDPPADELTPPKRKCTGELLQPEDMSSELLQCIFVAGKCIPLWPHVCTQLCTQYGRKVHSGRQEGRMADRTRASFKASSNTQQRRKVYFFQ